jgi:hypothetical protein
MKQPVARSFALVLLSLCFAIGTLGATYHECDMVTQTKQEQTLAGMDCHGDATTKTQSEKKCCIDLSCPKCFSSPVGSSKANTTATHITPSALVVAEAWYSSSIVHAALERPPKIADPSHT